MCFVSDDGLFCERSAVPELMYRKFMEMHIASISRARRAETGVFIGSGGAYLGKRLRLKMDRTFLVF